MHNVPEINAITQCWFCFPLLKLPCIEDHDLLAISYHDNDTGVLAEDEQRWYGEINHDILCLMWWGWT